MSVQRTNILHLDEETVLQEAQNLTLERSLEVMKQQGAVQANQHQIVQSVGAQLNITLRLFIRAALGDHCLSVYKQGKREEQTS